MKRNKRFIKDKFANIKDYPPVSIPVTIFMAGAPVGKRSFLLIIEKFTNQKKKKNC